MRRRLFNWRLVELVLEYHHLWGVISIDVLDFLMSGSFGPVSIGCSRPDVVRLLGEPEDWGGASKKWPSILRYGDIEFHFGPSPSGPLFLIHIELEAGTPSGGPTLSLSSCFLDSTLTLEGLRVAAHHHFPVDAAPWPWDAGARCVVTPGGVRLVFLAEGTAERLAIVDRVSTEDNERAPT